MKTPAQLATTIERFKKGFWDRQPIDYPLAAVVNTDVFLPIKYLRRTPELAYIRPRDVQPDLMMTDYDYAFARPAVSDDDWVPFQAPWRAIPWLEACCGCPVHYSDASLGVDACADSLEELTETPIPSNPEWLECMESETRRLTASAPTDCWISPSILRGPSDVIAAMRGPTEFMLDVLNDPDLIGKTADRINELIVNALKVHFSIVEPKCGGYGHIYGYWAPEKTIVIQEDAMGMCSPEIYRDLFMPYNQKIINHLGACVLFHLHSTGYMHYRDVLSLSGIAGLELTIEANGPDLMEMLPLLREILERSRLILFVDHYFEQLIEVVRQIPHEGLYLIIPDRNLPSNDAYWAFVNACR